MYIPSEEMGDYEEARSAKKKSGVLFPLDEEGTYGRPPSALPKPLPPYAKRERKPKVYASYAVSNECSMHAAKLEKNERKVTPPTRGKTPPSRRESTGPPVSRAPSRPKETAPTLTRSDSRRSSMSRKDSLSRKDSMSRRESTSRRESLSRRDSMSRRESVPRDTGYVGKAPSWQDSLRGASPSTPKIQRRPSTSRASQPRRSQPRTSASISPNRSRTISASPDRFRRQSTSPGRGGARSSTDWGYTDFSTFQANRKSSDNSVSSNRKLSSDRKSSAMSDRRASSSGYGRDESNSWRNSTANDYSSSSYSAGSTSRDYSASASYSSASRDYSGSYSMSKDYSSSSSNSMGGGLGKAGVGLRASSPSKISLGALKPAKINEWDQMGVLGLSSKMFSDSSNQQESYMTTSSSYMRRESVTTKVM